jgi:hypothetical protein
MRFAIMSIFLGLSISASVWAAEQGNSAEEYSRAFQQAKRVALMENGNDVPSRAFWLSHRVVSNSRSLQSVSKKKTRRAKLQNMPESRKTKEFPLVTK